MTRKFSNNVRTLLSSDNPKTFYLVKIDTVLGTIRDTTVPYNITVAGLGTFESNNNLLTVDPPQLSDSVDREAYKITYADSAFEKISMFETVITGADVTIYVGFYNTTDTVFGGVQPGFPLLSTDDMIVAYAGIVDTQGYSIDASEGKVIAMIECSSPMAALSMNRNLRTTPESLKNLSLTDTAFNQVFVKGSRIPWGKA